MRRPWLPYALAFLVLYLGFLLVQVPAATVYQVFAEKWAAKPPFTRLYGVSGNVWSGQAQVLEMAGQRFDGVTWDLHRLPLVRANLVADWRLRGSDIKASGLFGSSLFGTRRYLEQLKADVPLPRLASWINLPFGNLTGMLRLDLTQLEVDNHQWQRVEGRIDVLNASLAGRVPLELGNVQVNVKTEASGIVARLRDAGGGLQLDGEFKLSPQGAYQFSATLAARPNASQTLRDAVAMLGAPGADGRVRVTDAGKWPAF